MRYLNPKLALLISAVIAVGLTSCDSSRSGISTVEETGTKDRPVNVPESILHLLTGSLGPIKGSSGTPSAFSGSIYNGSDWVILDVDIMLTKTATNESRQYRLRMTEKKRKENYKLGDPYYTYSDIPLNPYSSGEAYVTSGDFTDDLEKGTFSSTLISARGYKP